MPQHESPEDKTARLLIKTPFPEMLELVGLGNKWSCLDQFLKSHGWTREEFTKTLFSDVMLDVAGLRKNKQIED